MLQTCRNLLKCWRSLWGRAQHITWASLGLKIPYIQAWAGQIHIRRLLCHLTNSVGSPRQGSSVDTNNHTLPSSCFAEGGGRNLYNWFLEHTSCFMCLSRSPKEMKGHPPPPPRFYPLVFPPCWMKDNCQVSRKKCGDAAGGGGHINHL